MVDVNTPQDNILYLSTALVVMDGEGSPEGVINAALGSLYCDKLTGNYYKKGSALGTLTGWTSFGGGGGGSIGGTIAAGQIAYGSAVNTIAGDGNLGWDSVGLNLKLGETSGGASISLYAPATGFRVVLAGPAVPTESESYTLPVTPPTVTGEILFVSSKGLNTQFGFTTNLTYTTVGRLSIDVTQNQSAYVTVNNLSSGNAAQSRIGAAANASSADLAVYSSGFTTSGLRVANSAVLDLNGPNAVILGQGAGIIQFGLGTSEYARLNTTRLGLLSLGLGATPAILDVFLERDAANILALRNSTNGQVFRIFGTYTDASNFECLSIQASTTGHYIYSRQNGSGTNRFLEFGTSNTGRWRIEATTGHFVASTDNTYDIGGITRPRTIYFGTSLIGVLWNLGGATSSFPAIGRSGASIVFQLADGTLQTPILPFNTNQLQFGGADAASPGSIALRVQNVLTGTSNTSGQNFSLYGCAGTGDQPGGQILLRVAPAGSSGTSQNHTIIGLGVTGSGQVYGAALHNNSAGMAGAVNQYVGSGTYSPTITAVANCTVTSPGVNFKYLRAGNVVHVTGQLSVDPTTASTLTRVRIALPIASNLTGSVGCQGVGACADVFGLCGAIYPDTTNDAAELNFICEGGTPANNVWCVSFSYEVA